MNQLVAIALMFGLVSASSAEHNNNKLSGRDKNLVECGQCFDQWSSSVAGLKDRSVDVIKLSHNLSYSLLTKSGIVIDGSDGFEVLDSRINAFGGMFLSNKQNGDRIQLLVTEFNSTMSQLEELGSELSAQEETVENLRSTLIWLEYRLNNQYDWLDTLNEFAREEHISPTTSSGSPKTGSMAISFGKRLRDMIYDYHALTEQLLRAINTTSTLMVDFSAHERNFSNQQTLLSLLHLEADELINNLQQKLSSVC